MRVPSTVRLRAFSFCCTLILLAGTSCVAQDDPLQDRLREKATDTPRDKDRSPIVDVDILVEGSIDANRYIVGPGDIFAVFLGGASPVSMQTQVSPDGRLVIPQAGSVPVAGLNLHQTRDRVLTTLRGYYRNIPLEISLTKPRSFWVHVTGSVVYPGRHVAGPVMRVSDVVQKAEPKALEEPYQPSTRNILLVRSGVERRVDLARYYATGDTTYNPYLLDGDIVHVPSYDPRRSGIFVNGSVSAPGVYDFKPGDTVRDILAAAGGVDSWDEVQEVRVLRAGAGGTLDSFVVTGQALRTSPGPALQRLDNVSVVPVRILASTAKVTGWVVHPGEYAIEPGRTTLRQLVQMAGGPRPGAQLESAFLTRPSLKDSTALTLASRHANLDIISRSYLFDELAALSTVPLDLGKVMEPGAPPVFVQAQDSLFVPRDNETIYIFGQVSRPGYFPFRAGANLDYYIDAANGLTNLAGPAYIIQRGSGQMLPARTNAISSGDMIFVDRSATIVSDPELARLAMEESRARDDIRLRKAGNLISIVSTVATLTFTYFTYRLVRN